MRGVVDAAVGRLGRIDVVVSNAGYGLFGPLEEFEEGDLRRQLETNFFGAVNLVRSVLPHLRRERSRHMILISSLEGITPLLAGETMYAASKFAAEGMFESLSKEVAPLGLAVTIVEPGPVRTDFAARAEIQRPSISDYLESVGSALVAFDQLAGNQPNDPTRVADAIIQAVDVDDPPL